MDLNRDEPTGADTLRYVFVSRARCPACDSADLHTIRSIDQGDGTRRKRTQCLKCFHKFFVILE
jgi:Zn ribbon nucleic-acid-binding protein